VSTVRRNLRISIIIPAHCTPARSGTSRLRLTLLSLARQTLPADAYEVILVDNASEPALAEQVESWGLGDRVRVLRREDKGQAAGYNAGLAQARAPVVLLGTDDEVVSPDVLAAHVQRHDDQDSCLVVGHCLTMFHTALVHDVHSGVAEPAALTRAATNADTAWVPKAAAAMGLLEKPVTDEDVITHFDRLVALAGFLPEFEDIERVVGTGRCHTLPGGWLAMRVGNHSLPTDVLRDLGGLDEALDAFGSWYLDLDLGIRLCDGGIAFHHAPDAVSVNLEHPRKPGPILGVLPAMAYLIGKHPRMDVALSPLYFQRGLRIAEYARLLRGSARWWPEHWAPSAP
jgi:glycosyltransferase involved in cell wall biosynthesis